MTDESRRRFERAQRRSADRQGDRIRDAIPDGTVLATVAAVQAGAATDGNALVTLTIRGNPVIAEGYMASYTPVVGHRVKCTWTTDSQLLIDGRIIGQP